MKELLEKWNQRLQRFKDHPNVVINGPTTPVLMGVQEGRVRALADCIRELEEFEKTSSQKSLSDVKSTLPTYQ